MNAGFVAIWLITIVIILLVTGWRELVADQVKPSSMTLLIVGCVLLWPFYVTLHREWLPPAGGTVSLSACWLTVWAIAAVLFNRPKGSLQRFYMIVAALLSSLMGGWLRLLYMNDPVLIIGHSSLDAAILTGAAAALSAPIQSQSLFAVVTIASVLQPLVMGWFAPAVAWRPVEIGSLAWWDGYMAALLSSRLMGLCIRVIKSAASKWFYPPEGEQEGGV
ncbi:hypothetical protein [Paenibacillus kobensis]|uniref:hypothetical protein n=1 Tax=Paenibacillus kobensis TaxID=59841 RepID=UPI000FD91CC6|nr:hypothetical protein [Paenibacillus kobensis]